MSQVKDLSAVIKSGMCIGCGACTFTKSGVTLRFDQERMMFQPDSIGDENAAKVCPAVQVDLDDLQRKLFPGDEISEHGVVKGVYLAQSKDLTRNLNASSGGLIKEIMLEYLRDSSIDGVIALSHKEGLSYEPKLIKSAQEVDSLPGSIYHNNSLENALKILHQCVKPVVLVGIPCQLEGIYNYIFNFNPALRSKIHATIGLICGWNYSLHALKAICHFKDVPYDRLTNVSYRGGGAVGKLRLQTLNGETVVNRRTDLSYHVAFDSSFNIPRCHLCVDHVNFLADIVVGDAWLPSTVKSKTGVSIVVCRTDAAKKLLNDISAAGKIELTPATTEEITESQSRNFTFGDFSHSYAEYLRGIGEYTPMINAPNRAKARLWSNARVSRFHKRFRRKTALQKRAAYDELWWQKMALEGWHIAWRYLRWFLVRVLKIKSLLGLRHETPTSNNFR